MKGMAQILAALLVINLVTGMCAQEQTEDAPVPEQVTQEVEAQDVPSVDESPDMTPTAQEAVQDKPPVQEPVQDQQEAPVQEEESVEVPQEIEQPQTEPEAVEEPAPDVVMGGEPLVEQTPTPTIEQQEAEATPEQVEAVEQDRAEQTQQLEKEQEAVDYGEGIDTVDVERGGNWLLKRVWWEKAERMFEKTKALLQRILDFRVQFFNGRSEIDQALNKFYVNIGYSQGELEQGVQNLINELEQERREDGMLDQDERELLYRLQENKKDVEQIKESVDAISDLDLSLDDALSKMVEQVNLCRNYEHQSWIKFKEIAQELDDEKAKELFYHMQTLYENMDDIYRYLTGPYANYFSNVTNTARQQMSMVSAKLDTLKAAGISLEYRHQELEQQELEQKREPKKPSFVAKIFGTIWDGVTGAVAWVNNVVRSLFHSVANVLGFGQSTSDGTAEQTAEKEAGFEQPPTMQEPHAQEPQEADQAA